VRYGATRLLLRSCRLTPGRRVWSHRIPLADVDQSNDISVVGPLLKKIGIRHICATADVVGFSESELSPFGVTLGCIPPLYNPPRQQLRADMKASMSEEEFKKHCRKCRMTASEGRRTRCKTSKCKICGNILGKGIPARRGFSLNCWESRRALTEAANRCLKNTGGSRRYCGIVQDKVSAHENTFGNSPAGFETQFIDMDSPKNIWTISG